MPLYRLEQPAIILQPEVKKSSTKWQVARTGREVPGLLAGSLSRGYSIRLKLQRLAIFRSIQSLAWIGNCLAFLGTIRLA
jgi:hypothetical protein